MAKKSSDSGQTRQHYEYARTGKVSGVGSVGGPSTAAGKNFKHGGRAKPRGRK